MTRLILFAACLIFTGPALAQGPLDGRWAWDEEDCSLEPGSSDRVPVVIAGNEIDYYESACTIASIEPIGDQDSAWNVELSCTGEGETWDEEAIFAIERDDSGDPLQLIEIDLEEGHVTARLYCE